MTSTRKTDQTEETGGDFASLLAMIRPATVREMGDEMRTLVRKIRDTGKGGSISLTLTIKPLDGETDVLAVNDEIRVKAPEHPRKGSLAFPDDEGNLSRTDPNTMPLFDEQLRSPAFEREDDVRTMPDHDARTGEIKEPPTA